ncbi:MAG: 30S ribosomal protein S1 [Phycisphaerae bacterium]|nr:30S ribosomal protein S1 [Phycisphaerae bacterium]
MVDKSIFNEFQIDEDAIDLQIQEALGALGDEQLLEMIDRTVCNFQPGTILTGTIVNHIGDDVIIEVGLKSEGAVSQSEFDNAEDIVMGNTVEVLLETVESDSGLVVLSKRKADRIRGWERIIETKKEGDVIIGKVTRRIKGGLLVDVGVPVFLPASQVDIRRPNDISEFINTDIEAVILKIDQERRNIVISRRKLLEETRATAKSKLLGDIEVGQVRKGVVKNIADFGAFIDLGGLDGLLHITDMSWGRVNHPSEIVKLDEKIDVKILSIDHDKEKIALGLKQKSESPWLTAKERYVVNSVVKGIVVNITNYGAFIKLEEGIEGLVHISEMSWTKRINHPGEMLSVGNEVDVVVLDVASEKQEISLGVKQLCENPWVQVVHKYPPGTIVTGKVRNLANYGAFIEIEEGIDGLLHVSDMSWTKKISHPGEMVKKGDEIQCIVLNVDQEKQRVGLGLKQMTEDPWAHAIPDTYIPGQIVHGVVTKLTNFGVFVELENDLEGLLHISELSDDKVEGPQDIVKVGQEVEVKILRVDIDDRKIGLSLKRAQWNEEEAAEEEGRSVRGGLDGAAGMGSNLIDASLFQKAKPVVKAPEESDKVDTEAVADTDTDEAPVEGE